MTVSNADHADHAASTTDMATRADFDPAHSGGQDVTILAIESSTALLALAILRNEKILGSVQSHAERNHSVLIVPEMKRLMTDCGIAPADLDVIAVGQGPGSYTGGRIAVTAGKTLAWSWNKVLLGISSLEALAFGAWEAAKDERTREKAGARQVWLVPAMDARRGQIYTARFEANSDGEWVRRDPDGIRMAADWLQQLGQEAEASGAAIDIWFVGDTESVAGLADNGMSGLSAIRAILFKMEASAVGKLAVKKFQLGEKDDIHSFVPNYTQLAEAEAKRLAAARGD